MKVAIALLPVLALACYAAPDVYIPWPQSEIQERNYYPSFGPVQEQDYPAPDTISASIQSKTSQKICTTPLFTGAVEAVYQTPDKGRVSLFVRNYRNDIVIVIDARVHWYGWENKLVLNSKPVHGSWQKEIHPLGFPFPCCGYVTTVTLRVEITDSEFIISANGNEIAKYPFRENLMPPITEVEYVFDDTGASLKAKLKSLSVYN